MRWKRSILQKNSMEIFLGICILTLGMILGFLMTMALYAFEYVLDRRHSIKMPRKLLERKLREMSIAKGSGSVLMPESDEEIARAAQIEKNRKAGRVTKLSDL
jgi:hypothetical protein